MSGRAILRRGLRRIPPPEESSAAGLVSVPVPRPGPQRPPPAPAAPRAEAPVTLTAPQSPGEGEGEGCTVQEKSPIHFPFRQQGKEEKKIKMPSTHNSSLNSPGGMRSRKHGPQGQSRGQKEAGFSLCLKPPASCHLAPAPPRFPHTCSFSRRRCPCHSQ